MNSTFFKHLHTVNTHRRLVRKGCFKIGLYYQGLTHDLSKYSPTEFKVGIKYWQGTRSPNNAEREDKGYSESWMHHKGRNKHHFEYWIDYGLVPGSQAYVCVPMPNKYIAEMLMDRVAASKVYKGRDYTDNAPYEYYASYPNAGEMHEQTREKLEFLLKLLAEKGEKELQRYIKEEFLKQ